MLVAAAGEVKKPDAAVLGRVYAARLPDGRSSDSQRLCGGHMRRLGLVVVFVASCVGTLSTPILAQVPTGTIAGTVTDQVAAVLPKATVTITNKDTGATRTVQTAADGSFNVPTLAPGPYDL